MNRHGFISLAGGIPTIPQRKNYRAQQTQQKYFWKFFAQTKWRKSVKAIYSDLNVDTLLRTKTYSIEHIIPRSILREQLRKLGSSKSIIHSAIFNPFNYAISHRKVNVYRSSTEYDLDGDHVVLPIKYYANQRLGLDGEGQWVVTERSRGVVARAIIYMCLLYRFNQIGEYPLVNYFSWASTYKIDLWELEYNRWIRKKYNICNPLIENCVGLKLDDILQDEDIVNACRP
jgi:hypothetical protein